MISYYTETDAFDGEGRVAAYRCNFHKQLSSVVNNMDYLAT